jgi:hypothetical protein
MTDERDLYDVQHIVPDDLADRLFAGTAVGDDLDGGLVTVASVLRAVRNPASGEELAGERAAAAAFASVVRSARAHAAARGPIRPSRRFPVKGVTVVVAATMLSAGVAAAATGHLPQGVQRAVSHSLSHVGVEVPNPDDQAPIVVLVTPAGTTGTTTGGQDTQDGGSSAGTVTTPGGVGVDNATREEQCTAYRAAVQPQGANKPGGSKDPSKRPQGAGKANGSPKPLTPAMAEALAAAAAAAGQSIEELCGLVSKAGSPAPSTASGPVGRSLPPASSGAAGQPGQRDQPPPGGRAPDGSGSAKPSASNTRPGGDRRSPSSPSSGRDDRNVTNAPVVPSSATSTTVAGTTTTT